MKRIKLLGDIIDKNACGIYKITSPTGRVYIGESKDLKRRVRDYNRTLAVGQNKLERSLSKYGIEFHIFEVIELCNFEDLKCRERYWQDYYNSMYNGLNCVLTECGELKREISQEHRDRISALFKGVPKTEEHKQKIGNANRGNTGMRGKDSPNYGVRKFGTHNPFYNKKHTDETKKLLSELRKGKTSSRKGAKLGKETIELIVSKKRVPVLQYSKDGVFIAEWGGIRIAEKQLNIFNIGKCCKGIMKSAGGFIWEYKKN